MFVDTGARVGEPSDSLHVNGFLSVEHRLHALLITKHSLLYETTSNFEVIKVETDGQSCINHSSNDHKYMKHTHN